MIHILLIILLCSIVAFLIYASSSIQAGIYVKSICTFAPPQGDSAKGEEESEKSLLLSFDDGPDPVQTPKILSILDKHNIKALFFLVGEKIEKEEDTALSIIRAGHLAGSHSYSHNPYYPIWGYRRIKADLELGQKRIAELLQCVQKKVPQTEICGTFAKAYFSVISACSSCRDFTSRAPCFFTLRIPSAVAFAAAIVVIYGTCALIAFLRM